MNPGRLFAGAAVAIALLLAACGGGNDGGVTTPQTPPVATATGSDKFLLFPNPQQESLSDKTQHTNELAYAQAYYAAIDPGNERDTLEKWKLKNGFGGPGTEVTVAFGDKRDLGYGRRMTARRNANGDIAFLVENYQVDPGGAYGFSSLSVEAAVRQDKRWLILINAIEYSPVSTGGIAFAKFFNFNPVTGERETSVDLDGRGRKFMPSPCLTCHGGRGDRLVAEGGGLQFPVIRNSESLARGDVQAHFHPLEVDSFEFSDITSYTRFEQEAKLKIMNTFVLCSYPLPAAPASPDIGVPAGFCPRRTANSSEWQGTAADIIVNAYGGNGLPLSVYSGTVVPPGWIGHEDLYRDVVTPSCRACHILRGTAGPLTPQSEIDFNSFAKFQSYADRIKSHAIDRGDMPLAKFVFDAFWKPPNPGPETLAKFLAGENFTVRDAANAVLQPGRPIADPGPDRVIARAPTPLTASGSLFATSFHWTVATRPNGAAPTLSNPDSENPVFEASIDGTYVLQLVASNGSTQSAPANLTLVVNNALFPKQDAIRFDDVKTVLDKATCISCHVPGVTPVPPVFFANTSPTGPVLRTDDAFYDEVRSRINFTNIFESPLLRKPSGNHHSGGLLGGVLGGFEPDLAAPTADPNNNSHSNYNLILNWIMRGAP